MLRHDDEDGIDALGAVMLMAVAIAALIFVAMLALALWVGWI